MSSVWLKITLIKIKKKKKNAEKSQCILISRSAAPSGSCFLFELTVWCPCVGSVGCVTFSLLLNVYIVSIRRFQFRGNCTFNLLHLHKIINRGISCSAIPASAWSAFGMLMGVARALSFYSAVPSHPCPPWITSDFTDH